MKLIVQIPCFNEEAQLAATLAGLPRAIAGFDSVERLIVDDASSDGTLHVARVCGVDHIVRLRKHQGLGAAFQAGIDAALKLGADVIVNIDADNQFFGEDVARIVMPILAGEADVVIGDRRTSEIDYFTRRKRLVHRFGARVVRRTARTAVADPTCGLRAFTRASATELVITRKFTYTLEAVIEGGRSRAGIAAVPVATRPATRPSRLYRCTRTAVTANVGWLVREHCRRRPGGTFGLLAGGLSAGGATLCAVGGIRLMPMAGALRVVFTVGGASLVVSGAMIAALAVVGIFATYLGDGERQLLAAIRRVEHAGRVPPSHHERPPAPLPAIPDDPVPSEQCGDAVSA
jgi:hypothetical protein